MRVGIDNYALLPLNLAPLEILRWAKNHNAEGIQFSGLSSDTGTYTEKSYLKDLAQYAAENDLYLEWGGGQHIPRDMQTWDKKDILPINRKAAEEAACLDVRIVRSCSGGLMRWQEASPTTETFLKEMASVLKTQRSMLRDHNVILAIETHFEFTTFELLRLMEMCEADPGDYLGICLDTMNLLTMLEEPVSATQRILPWVVSTHIKDGGILLNKGGMLTFPAEIGSGVVGLADIIFLLAGLAHEVNLSVEDHGGDFVLPIFDHQFLEKFPDLTALEFADLLLLAQLTQELLQQKSLEITRREIWPEICEERVIRDIQALKALRQKALS